MPTFQANPDLAMHYEIDDFTDPWRQPETILLLHGNAESSAAWYGWVPLAPRRRCRATSGGPLIFSSTTSRG